MFFFFTMLGSQIDLYFWNRMPLYFARARGAYKSPACRNLCIITLLLLWPDPGQHGSSAKILISRWKRRQNSELSFVILRTAWKLKFRGRFWTFYIWGMNFSSFQAMEPKNEPS